MTQQLITTLTPNQTDDIMRRFPTFELSYETVSHKKVSSDYNTCLAIPYGKKAFMWFSFLRDNDVCFLMELGREKKVGRVQMVQLDNVNRLSLGTLFYGTICEVGDSPNMTRYFVIEELLFWQGISLVKLPFGEKLGFLHSFFQDPKNTQILSAINIAQLKLPIMWGISEDEINNTHIPPNWTNRIPYTIHHLQYRSLTTIFPYINVTMTQGNTAIVKSAPAPLLDEFVFIPPALPKYDFAKPQYKMPTIFEVKADLQNDIYHLYAYGQSSQRIYCGLANIPSYKTSVFMNGLFRNIKENRNLDSMEESDDEDDFQDMRIDKHVDLKKTLAIECIFNTKFKRWVPVRLIPDKMRLYDNGKIVHISRLVFGSQQSNLPHQGSTNNYQNKYSNNNASNHRQDNSFQKMNKQYKQRQ